MGHGKLQVTSRTGQFMTECLVTGTVKVYVDWLSYVCMWKKEANDDLTEVQFLTLSMSYCMVVSFTNPEVVKILFFTWSITLEGKPIFIFQTMAFVLFFLYLWVVISIIDILPRCIMWKVMVVFHHNRVIVDNTHIAILVTARHICKPLPPKFLYISFIISVLNTKNKRLDVFMRVKAKNSWPQNVSGLIGLIFFERPTLVQFLVVLSIA